MSFKKPTDSCKPESSLSYMKFVQSFGPSLFSLWKFSLLHKRILFYSSPPIGDLCWRVYCTCEMASTQVGQIKSKQSIKPFFYVNVADIDMLQQESFYFACKLPGVVVEMPFFELELQPFFGLSRYHGENIRVQELPV